MYEWVCAGEWVNEWVSKWIAQAPQQDRTISLALAHTQHGAQRKRAVSLFGTGAEAATTAATGRRGGEGGLG